MALTSNNGNLKVPSTPKSEKRERDTDSDSGISIEISKTPSPRSPIKPIPHEPLTTKEQEKPLPNYTLMVQEAIVALTNDKNANGCSLLGIFLYILHNYSTLESVEIMNEKIRSTLALLKRMGIVQRVDNHTNEDNDELEYEPKIVHDKVQEDLEDDLEIIKVVQQPKNKNKVEKTESKNLVAKKKVAKILKSNQNAKKPSSPKAGKENSNSQTPGTQVIYKPKRLSPALSTICGRKLLTRHDALKAIWKYIKQHKLQDPVQRTIIVCDDKLKAVTKKKRVTSAEILTCLGQNMTTI